MTRHIPNTVTMVNLACGCLALVYCFEGNFPYVLMLMGVALLADFADGLLARALNVKSQLGMELDSLADAVTFGVLPGVMLYMLIGDAVFPEGHPATLLHAGHFGFLFTICAVLRLAKFNIDMRQQDTFLGLATPAASVFVAGIMVIHVAEVPMFAKMLNNGPLLIGLTIVLGILMVSRIPMFSFKVKGTRWQGNETRVMFIVLSIVLVILLKWAVLPFLIILYVVMSLLEDVLVRRK